MSQIFPTTLGVVATQTVGPLAGFGEASVAQPTPTSQVAFVYTVNTDQVTTWTYGTGAAVSTVAGEVLVTSGTTATGYARIYGSRVASYRPGQGTRLNVTARFAPGVADNRQLAGMTSGEGSYQFGYVGTTFGILHTITATREVQTLTVTASTGAGTIAVALEGGTPVNTAIGGVLSANLVASAIAAGNYSQVAGGWDATAVGDIVYFTKRLAGVAAGSTFNAGTTGSTGTFAVLTAGVAPTEEFAPQTSWNGDRFDGTGISGVTLDWSKGNIFQIQYQYLGYGDAIFSVENPTTGRFERCHTIVNANKRTTTVLRNPSGYITWESRNTGSTTGATLRGASGAAFVEGTEYFLGARRAYLSSKSISAATETPILTLRASRVFGNRASTGQIVLARLTVAADGTKPVDLKVYRNKPITAPQFTRVNGATSFAEVDTAATGVSAGGMLVYAFTVAKTGNSTDDLESLQLFAEAGDTFTVTAYSANGADVSVALSWVED